MRVRPIPERQRPAVQAAIQAAFAKAPLGAERPPEVFFCDDHFVAEPLPDSVSHTSHEGLTAVLGCLRAWVAPQSTLASVESAGGCIGLGADKPVEAHKRRSDVVGDDRPRILVVMPAYNAGRTLVDTWGAIPANLVDEVLLVDDGSRDDTLTVAASLPIRTIGLPHNVGYGGNQKTCYLEALRRGAEVIVMLHPDGQYDPALLPDLVAPVLAGEADLVLGSRMLVPGGARAGGMPLYRYVSNKALTAVENRMLGTRHSELHTGYRAYSRRFLETVPFMRNSDGFVFDTEVIAQAVAFGQRIVEVPITTRYFPEASSTSMRANVHYGLGTLATMLRYLLHRQRVLRSRLFKP